MQCIVGLCERNPTIVACEKTHFPRAGRIHRKIMCIVGSLCSPWKNMCIAH